VRRPSAARRSGPSAALALVLGFDNHVPKGCIDFAMAFSLCVEMQNIRARKRAKAPVALHSPYRDEGTR